ncbi:MAG: metallophosphoesterase [Anaeromyxobacter sp.]
MVTAAGAGVVPTDGLAGDDGLRHEQVTFKVPGLDPAHDGLRVAQLSDLHVGNRTPDAMLRDAIAQANAFQPDLVVLTGDYVCRKPWEVGKMREVLGGLAAPTLCVLGNHDVWVDAPGAADSLRALGYEVLDNAWTTLRVRGEPLHVVGVGDFHTKRADVPRAMAGLPDSVTPLVLAHGPRTADELRARNRPMVCMSGHTHGGQISIPILTPLFLASMAHEPYVRGRYKLGDVQLYVNRGIGLSGIKVRINSPPEVTLATLRRA